MNDAKPTLRVRRTMWRDGAFVNGERDIPEEAAIAFVYDGATEAVMMATPADLEDFAIGFSLTEGIIGAASDIQSLEIVKQSRGIEIRMALKDKARDDAEKRRRYRAGPVGCGLCGIESLEQAMRPLPKVTSTLHVKAQDIVAAMAALSERQTLNRLSHAVHGAGFYVPDEGIIAVREDVGRHNALDKLAGALAREGRMPGTGAILMTSRLSVELVQKAAMLGAGIIASISAPTATSIRMAHEANIALAGIVRADGLEIFTGHERFGSADTLEKAKTRAS